MGHDIITAPRHAPRAPVKPPRAGPPRIPPPDPRLFLRNKKTLAPKRKTRPGMWITKILFFVFFKPCIIRLILKSKKT